MPNFVQICAIVNELWMIDEITACAVATSSCISDVPSQWEGQNFDPPLLPHFSTNLNETWNQERYAGYDPTSNIWLMWDDGKGVCVGREFSVTFCVLSFLVRPKTIVFGRTYVLAQMFYFFFPREISEMRCLTGVKFCMMVSTRHYFIMPVQNFGGHNFYMR